MSPPDSSREKKRDIAGGAAGGAVLSTIYVLITAMSELSHSAILVFVSKDQ